MALLMNVSDLEEIPDPLQEKSINRNSCRETVRQYTRVVSNLIPFSCRFGYIWAKNLQYTTVIFRIKQSLTGGCDSVLCRIMLKGELAKQAISAELPMPGLTLPVLLEVKSDRETFI